MHRLVAALTASFLVFFAVMFGMRFWEAGTLPFKAQVSQGQFTSWPLASDRIQSDLVAGADGSMWASSYISGSWSSTKGSLYVTRISKDGTTKDFLLYSDCDGAFDARYRIEGFADKIWFATCFTGAGAVAKLASIDLDGTITNYGSAPGANANESLLLNAGVDGTLWAFAGTTGKFKISPSGQFTSFSMSPDYYSPDRPYSEPRPNGWAKLSKGNDGSMWTYLSSTVDFYTFKGYYAKIAPSGAGTLYDFPAAPNPQPSTELARGSDGNMWYMAATSQKNTDGSTADRKFFLGKISADGTYQNFPAPDGIIIGKVAAGPDGNVWFTYCDGNTLAYTCATSGGLGKITPQGVITLLPVAEGIPSRLAESQDGNVWFTTYVQDPVTRQYSYKVVKLAVTSSAASVAPASSSSRSSGASSVAPVSSVSSSKQSSAATLGDRCGNGILNSGEACDDANKDSGDGCSSSCQLERGYSCSGIYCIEICGDGIITKSEQCDDNNRRSGDGCSAVCLPEGGTSVNTNSAFIAESCGNGFQDSGEECDDANTKSGDGCSSSCLVEDGYSCYATACATVCGDAKKRGKEECDDGNRANGDGCTNFCRIETGYECFGSTCYVVCGDGVALGQEECDDGDIASGDGCSSNCRTEKDWVCGGRPSQCYYQGAPAQASSAGTSVIASSAASRASSVTPVAASSSSQGSSQPFLVPDWLFPRSSSKSSSSQFSLVAIPSSSSVPASSSVSSSVSSSSSSEASSESSASSASSALPCGNGIQEAGEECDAGSLNGSPVTQCSVDCTLLKAAAGSSSDTSVASAAVTESGTRMNPLLLMFLVAFAVVVIGGIGAFVWMRVKKYVE